MAQAHDPGATVPNRRSWGTSLAVLAVLGALALVTLHGAAVLSFGLIALDVGLTLANTAFAALVLLIVIALLGLAHAFGAKLIGRCLGVREE